jgi:hypothetical protein
MGPVLVGGLGTGRLLNVRRRPTGGVRVFVAGVRFATPTSMRHSVNHWARPSVRSDGTLWQVEERSSAGASDRCPSVLAGGDLSSLLSQGCSACCAADSVPLVVARGHSRLGYSFDATDSNHNRHRGGQAQHGLALGGKRLELLKAHEGVSGPLVGGRKIVARRHGGPSDYRIRAMRAPGSP